MRAQVVLIHNGAILLARHKRGDGHYWVLPGGGVEQGETPDQCAIREVKEESGLDVRLDRLLFVDGPREAPGIRITQPRYTYLGITVGGCLEHVQDGEDHGENGRLCGVAWMPFENDEYDAATRDTLSLVRQALSMS